MEKVVVCGSSDDLIVLDGDIRDEFGVYDGARHLTFADGTILKVEYAPEGYGAKWKIECVRQGTARYEHVPAKNEDREYSDVATLTGDVRGYVRFTEGPEISGDEIVETLGHVDWGDYDRDVLLNVLKLIGK